MTQYAILCVLMTLALVTASNLVLYQTILGITGVVKHDLLQVKPKNGIVDYILHTHKALDQ